MCKIVNIETIFVISVSHSLKFMEKTKKRFCCVNERHKRTVSLREVSIL